MGLLGRQQPRDYFRADLEGFLEEAATLAEKFEVDVATVVRAKHAIELERRNSIACQQGDYLDEQLGGFGKLLETLAEAVADIAASRHESES